MTNTPNPNTTSVFPSFSFDSVLNDDEKRALFENSTRVSFSKRETIITQNAEVKSIPFIQSGLVKLSKEMRVDKNMLIRIAKPGCFLGLPSVFGSTHYEYSIYSIDNSVVWFIDIEAFKKIIMNNGLFSLEIIKLLSSNAIFNINRLSGLIHKQLPGRIADIILYFSEEIFMQDAFTIPLTRLELAELAGTTKESLIRTLSEFKNDKIIDVNRNYIRIKSMHIIKTLSRLG